MQTPHHLAAMQPTDRLNAATIKLAAIASEYAQIHLVPPRFGAAQAEYDAATHAVLVAQGIRPPADGLAEMVAAAADRVLETGAGL